MDWISLSAAVGLSGIVTTVVTAVLNKRINKASADNLSADYTGKIIDQCDERVKQALEDKERMLTERDQAFEKAVKEREEKEVWRGKYNESVESSHALKLEHKDEIHALIMAQQRYRCEVDNCRKRIPPRPDELKNNQNEIQQTKP